MDVQIDSVACCATAPQRQCADPLFAVACFGFTSISYISGDFPSSFTHCVAFNTFRFVSYCCLYNGIPTSRNLHPRPLTLAPPHPPVPILRLPHPHPPLPNTTTPCQRRIRIHPDLFLHPRALRFPVFLPFLHLLLPTKPTPTRIPHCPTSPNPSASGILRPSLFVL